jgi:hypothetical protein
MNGTLMAGASPLLELWGMTELGGAGTCNSTYAPNLHGSIGVALPGLEAVASWSFSGMQTNVRPRSARACWPPSSKALSPEILRHRGGVYVLHPRRGGGWAGVNGLACSPLVHDARSLVGDRTP